MKDVVIIGAGITGLSIALHLKKHSNDFVVLDKSNRTGGVIHTVSENGFTYEEGPNSGVIGNVEVSRLFKELKDDCELEEAGANVKKRYILKDGKWYALPSGPISAITTPLFTLSDKFRVLGEPWRKPGTNPHENLADFVKRRLGNSFLDYAVDPFIIGVYAGDPQCLIPKYALPKLYNLEQNYGSFIKGTLKKRKEPKTEEEKQVSRGVFSVKGGLTNLIKAAEKNIGLKNIKLNAENISVNLIGKHYIVTYNQNGTKTEIETKNVISTIGGHHLDEILPFVDSKLMNDIKALHYTNVIEIVLGFNKWNGFKLDAFGGLIPFKEKRDILGILFMSALFEGRAPKDGALFSIFMGGVRRPDVYVLPDDEVKKVIEREVCNIMQIDTFNPDLFKIIRHEYAIPQYEVSSKERFFAIEEIEKQYPGLIIGGNLRNGIGMADRIKQGEELAMAIYKKSLLLSS